MDAIQDFLSGTQFAVAGASTDRSKFGNRVLRAYLESGLEVTPVHPTEAAIEGVAAVRSVLDLPDGVHGLSVVTPPAVTERVLAAAAERGIQRVWMQPGAESDTAIRQAREFGLTVIAGGPCVLVELARRRS